MGAEGFDLPRGRSEHVGAQAARFASHVEFGADQQVDGEGPLEDLDRWCSRYSLGEDPHHLVARGVGRVQDAALGVAAFEAQIDVEGIVCVRSQIETRSERDHLTYALGPFAHDQVHNRRMA